MKKPKSDVLTLYFVFYMYNITSYSLIILISHNISSLLSEDTKNDCGGGAKIIIIIIINDCKTCSTWLFRQKHLK